MININTGKTGLNECMTEVINLLTGKIKIKNIDNFDAVVLILQNIYTYNHFQGGIFNRIININMAIEDYETKYPKILRSLNPNCPYTKLCRNEINNEIIAVWQEIKNISNDVFIDYRVIGKFKQTIPQDDILALSLFNQSINHYKQGLSTWQELQVELNRLYHDLDLPKDNTNIVSEMDCCSSLLEKFENFRYYAQVEVDLLNIKAVIKDVFMNERTIAMITECGLYDVAFNMFSKEFTNDRYFSHNSISRFIDWVKAKAIPYLTTNLDSYSTKAFPKEKAQSFFHNGNYDELFELLKQSPNLTDLQKKQAKDLSNEYALKGTNLKLINHLQNLINYV